MISLCLINHILHNPPSLDIFLLLINVPFHNQLPSQRVAAKAIHAQIMLRICSAVSVITSPVTSFKKERAFSRHMLDTAQAVQY
jgi:hypothetical protein